MDLDTIRRVQTVVLDELHGYGRLGGVDTARIAVLRAEWSRRADSVAAAGRLARLAEKWMYNRSEDPMTSRVTRSATILSENLVEFSSPYDGPQHATLTLRDHPSFGKDVIFQISRGQLLCSSYDGCSVRVRFDEGRAERWHANEPKDHSSTILFISRDERFRRLMEAAEIVRIQVEAYQEGAPVFEFHVGGFDAKRFASAGGS